jgi:hypothetical protein
MSKREMARPASQREASEAGREFGDDSTTLRRVIFVVVVAALLLVASFTAGWLLRGEDGASPPSYVVSGAVVAGDQLTDRQREMVDLTEQYVAAFIAKDGDAVASFMVPDGYLAMPTLGDQIVHASDRSLQDWVEQTGTIPNELNDPIAVYENQVVLTGHLGDALDWMILIEFTDSGEVKIVSDTHWAYQ